MKTPYFCSHLQDGDFNIILDVAPGWKNLFRRLWFSEYSKSWTGLGPIHKDNVEPIAMVDLPPDIKETFHSLIAELFEDRVWLSQDVATK